MACLTGFGPIVMTGGLVPWPLPVRGLALDEKIGPIGHVVRLEFKA